MKGCVIMSLKKMDFGKAFAMIFVLIFSVTAALPAMSVNAVTNKAGIGYGYSRQAYYNKPYIFDIAWNFSDKTEKLYSSTKVALSDKVSMTVWYKGNLKTDMSDKNVVSALSDVLNSIKTEQPEHAKTVVLEIKNTGDASPEKLVEQYYKSGDIMFYAAVLPFADSKTQKTYLERSYSTNNMAFFTVSLDALDNAEIIEKYLSKAYKDNNIAVFAVCFDHLEDVLNDKEFNSMINKYAEKAYADDRISFFAVLVDRMDRNTVEAWFDKAVKDGKVVFASVFDDYWDGFDDAWADFDDAWNDFDDKWSNYENYINSSDYAKYGVTYNDGNYYYNKKLLRHFLDWHNDKDTVNVAVIETNPKGKVDIKIVRDKNGNITGVEYLTEEEIEKFFGDWSCWY